MGIRFHVDPRCVPKAVAARRIGVTEARFADVQQDLQRQGFPKPDGITGNYDLVAIDAWLDRRAGLAKNQPAAADPADGFMERLARLG